MCLSHNFVKKSLKTNAFQFKIEDAYVGVVIKFPNKFLCELGATSELLEKLQSLHPKVELCLLNFLD